MFGAAALFYILELRISKKSKIMKALRPQDIAVVLKLVCIQKPRPTYAELANDLLMSQSEVHASIQRARAAKLLLGPELGDKPNIPALEEFLIHGLKYAFPPERGAITRGLPTANAADPLKRKMTQEEPSPVWPFEKGPKRGYSFLPLYKRAPEAALKDQQLYELLALVDSIRSGSARERELAQRELSSRLRGSS
jgi:hypothetical protein